MMNASKAWTASQTAAGRRFGDAWSKFAKQQRGESAGPMLETLTGLAHVVAVQEKHEAAILARANVVGVAASKKMTGGTISNKDALLVLVEKKVAPDKLSEADMVPPEIDGVETDVVEVGLIEALAFDAHVRPALPGFSIGHYNITAGTFGALVRDVRSGDVMILSNNHVLADVNKARPGDKILQPGPFDGGVYPSDMVATFERTEEIVFTRTPDFTGGYNLVDAALARPTDSRNVTASIIGVAAPTGVGQALPTMNVVKAGRTTEVTVGVVLATNASVAVGYGADVALFRHQIITTAMAAGGDSGSLLMDFDLRGIGLLFAGSPQITIHNHLLDVQNTLGVELVTTR